MKENERKKKLFFTKKKLFFTVDSIQGSSLSFVKQRCICIVFMFYVSEGEKKLNLVDTETFAPF